MLLMILSLTLKQYDKGVVTSRLGRYGEAWHGRLGMVGLAWHGRRGEVGMTWIGWDGRAG